MGVVSHQGGLSSGGLASGGPSSGGLPSGVPIMVVFLPGGLSSGWSLFRVVFYLSGFSYGWSFIIVVSHHDDLLS